MTSPKLCEAHADSYQILSDYDAQLTHLRKELGLVQEEYAQWEAASRPRS